MKWLFASASLVALSLLSAAGLVLADSKDAFVAVVLPPWWSQAEAVAAAGESGAIAGVGAVPFIIVIPNDPTLPRLRGEWMRLHLSILSGCFGEKPTS